MKVGLAGFPGSGKTTVFNALTGQSIEVGFSGRGGKPVLGAVKVPDQRIDALAEIYQPRKVTLAEMVFMDIPSGAASGSRTLDTSTIVTLREVEALALVVRGFPAADGTLANPLAELQDFHTELTLADLAPVEKRLERLKKEKGTYPGEAELLQKIKDQLEQGKPIREFSLTEQEEQRLAGYRFLTQKPLIVVYNVAEAELNQPISNEMMNYFKEHHLGFIIMSGPIEMEIARLPKEEQGAFAKDLGLSEPAVGRFVQTTYAALDLISFLTAGEDECRAWTIQRGTTAQRAAGKIHSDIERGFIRAEVMPFEDFVKLKSEAKMREAGKLRLEGKEYIVKDGEIVHFRHAT